MVIVLVINVELNLYFRFVLVFPSRTVKIIGDPIIFILVWSHASDRVISCMNLHLTHVLPH